MLLLDQCKVGLLPNCGPLYIGDPRLEYVLLVGMAGRDQVAIAEAMGRGVMRLLRSLRWNLGHLPRLCGANLSRTWRYSRCSQVGTPRTSYKDFQISPSPNDQLNTRLACVRLAQSFHFTRNPQITHTQKVLFFPYAQLLAFVYVSKRI